MTNSVHTIENHFKACGTPIFQVENQFADWQAFTIVRFPPEEGTHMNASLSHLPLSPSRASDQRRLSPVFVGEAPVDRAKQRRESALSHQEALREQVPHPIDEISSNTDVD